MVVKPKRHIAKAITWRVLATSTTFSLVWIISGKIDIALKVGVLEIMAKLIIYYFHERAWYKFSKFGVKKTNRQTKKFHR